MRRCVSIFVAIVLLAGSVRAEMRFPAPDFKGGYQLPQTVTSPTRAAVMAAIDVAALAGSLGVGMWLIYTKRSRRAVFVLMAASLVYFGFYRKGCVCPVGSIQNVAAAVGGHGALPWLVAAFFALPLGFALFAGRVFCAGVCPLGAIQDLMLWKPVRVPAWLEQALGLFPFLYLGVAVLYASVGSSRFLVCEYDPFVGFFRMSATAHMLLLGGVLLGMSLFVGRVYCRFICPYSVLLRWASPFASRRVSITPKECVDCRLCETACPFGAIRHPTPMQRMQNPTKGRGGLVGLLVLLPLGMGAMAFVGYLASPAMARLDFVVRVAERVALEEGHRVEGTTEESAAFRATGQEVEQLYARAHIIEHQFAAGGAILGAYMGLVIGAKLIAYTMRRRRVGYTTDPAACLACARCYKSCPVEIEHNQELAASVV